MISVGGKQTNVSFKTRLFEGLDMLRHILHMARSVPMIGGGEREEERGGQVKVEEKTGSKIA